MRIEVNQVSKSYGRRDVLRKVTLEAPSEKLTALLGPSGSGKSTLLRIIAGLETLDSGNVIFDGRTVTRTPVRDRNIGFCFQDYAPFRHMSVFDNVAYGLRVRRESESVIKSEVVQLLERMGLADHSRQRPHELSGGQRQRMSLARALAIKPSVLLLDEPFAALDAQVRGDIRAFVRGLQHELGITTILVTHDQSEAMEVADFIAVLDEGVVQQVGPPQMVYDAPSNDFVKSFLGPTTQFRGSTVRPHQLELRDGGSGEGGTVVDIVSLGFEVRVHVALLDGSRTWVQVTHAEALQRGYVVGQRVVVAPRAHSVKAGTSMNVAY